MYASAALFALLASTASASVLPRVPPSSSWDVTDFSVASEGPGGAVEYKFDITNDYIGGSCSAETNFIDGQCPGGAYTPTTVSNQTCSATFWTWEILSGQNPANTSETGLILKVAYTTPDANSAFGCKYLGDNVTCINDPNQPDGGSSVLVAPSNFTIQGGDVTDCEYAQSN